MPQGTLKKMIRGMLVDARRNPGRPVVRAMGVFTLEITQLETGLLQVAMERLNTAPAQADWERILAQWPEPVPANVVPSARSEGRRRALVGRWARPAEMTEAV